MPAPAADPTPVPAPKQTRPPSTPPPVHEDDDDRDNDDYNDNDDENDDRNDDYFGGDFEGVIHVHHIKPLSQISQKYVVNPIHDLVPVCPNCHLVIHSKPGGVYSIAETKVLIKKHRL